MKGITSIRELVSEGLYSEALSLYARLRSSGFLPNDFTFPSLLKACAKLQSSLEARKLHTHVVKTGFLSQVHAATALTDVYMKLQLLNDALKVFNEIPNRNLACSNALITGFVQNGCFGEALSVVRQLQGRGLRLNSVTLACVLPACGHITEGVMLHGVAVKMGWEIDTYVATAVLTMYSNCGEIDRALKAFLLMPYKEMANYNAIMSGLLHNGCPWMVIDLFKEMRGIVGETANSVTWLSLLAACSGLLDSALQAGKEVHCFLLKRDVEFDVKLGTAFVDMYSKCGSPRSAYRLFCCLNDKNSMTWNSMISGLFLHGQGDKAVDLFQQMKLQGLKPDPATWNTMVNGFSKLGNGLEALKYFKKMQIEGSTRPTLKLVTSILPACSLLCDLIHGREIHGHIIRTDYSDDRFVSTAVIDMYMKCGCPFKAQQIFYCVDKQYADIAMWNAMIDGYGRNGENERALEIFYQMLRERVKPNAATFLSLISACGEHGHIENARELFEIMSREHGIEPSVKHLSCMITLLGRVGKLQEAQELCRQISKPSASVLASILGSSKVHSDIALGKEMAERLAELDPAGASPFVILSGIYAQKGMWVETQRVWEEMRSRGLNKVPGYSWIAK